MTTSTSSSSSSSNHQLSTQFTIRNLIKSIMLDTTINESVCIQSNKSCTVLENTTDDHSTMVPFLLFHSVCTDHYWNNGEGREV
mmetsp:Transcript_23028/g.23291  ORF Transcript_23028/g.23291 Transcript_23028/m.23291 type:complete len:84 (+) Transcript_23028:2-253(+)